MRQLDGLSCNGGPRRLCSFAVGEAKVTFGTGAFLLMNAGDAPVPSQHGLLSTALYQFGAGGKTEYALEGAVASCAVGINWFRDSLRMIDTPPQISDLAADCQQRRKDQQLRW